jgi:hypothetical protein
MANHWLEPFVRLRSVAAQHGIEMDTWDMHPLEEADLVLWLDLPQRRSDIIEARRRSPHAKYILVLWESPLGRPHYFRRENHEMFDAVLTYNPHLCDEKRYFRFFLPLGAPQPAEDVPFCERRPLVILNTNRVIGAWAPRQTGAAGLPFLGPVFSGYKVGLWPLLRQNAGELYSRRRRIARLAEQLAPDCLDIYGAGWSGERMSWVHRLLPNRKYGMSRGAFTGQKTTLLARYCFVLAFENMRGDVGYVSEKIFDAIFSGAVPIYLGDERITETVPADCFVDARNFACDADIFDFAANCGESQWLKLRSAGRDFVSSPRMHRFTSEGFAERMLQVLTIVTSRPVGPETPTT